MVYEAAKAVRIPILGMGGVRTPEDALELILAGASMVAVGTANFNDPRAAIRVIEGIEDYMQRHGISDIRELVGAVL